MLPACFNLTLILLWPRPSLYHVASSQSYSPVLRKFLMQSHRGIWAKSPCAVRTESTEKGRTLMLPAGTQCTNPLVSTKNRELDDSRKTWPAQRVYATASIPAMPTVQSNGGIFWKNVSSVHKAYEPTCTGTVTFKSKFCSWWRSSFWYTAHFSLRTCCLHKTPYKLVWEIQIILCITERPISTDTCYLLEPVRVLPHDPIRG